MPSVGWCLQQKKWLQPPEIMWNRCTKLESSVKKMTAPARAAHWPKNAQILKNSNTSRGFSETPSLAFQLLIGIGFGVKDIDHSGRSFTISAFQGKTHKEGTQALCQWRRTHAIPNHASEIGLSHARWDGHVPWETMQHEQLLRQHHGVLREAVEECASSHSREATMLVAARPSIVALAHINETFCHCLLNLRVPRRKWYSQAVKSFSGNDIQQIQNPLGMWNAKTLKFIPACPWAVGGRDQQTFTNGSRALAPFGSPLNHWFLALALLRPPKFNNGILYLRCMSFSLC